MPIQADGFLFHFLRDDLASEDMSVNGSVEEQVFSYTAINDGAEIERINFVIADAAIRIYDQFGGISPLTNGLTVKVYDTDGTTVLKDFMNGMTIKRNSDFAFLAGSDVPIADTAGNDMISVRWTIAKAGSRLRLKKGQSFRIGVNDDLTAIAYFAAMIQGVLS